MTRRRVAFEFARKRERYQCRVSGSVGRTAFGAQGTVTRRAGIAPSVARGSPASASEYGPVPAGRDAPLPELEIGRSGHKNYKAFSIWGDGHSVGHTAQSGLKPDPCKPATAAH